jgi:glycosyltransferase involved in cell wall biosynthesis
MYLVSPLPPKRTGTADYLRELAIEMFATRPDAHDHVTFVDRDPQSDNANGLPAGARVIDVREMRMGETDTVVYFLAANDFHHFVLESLAGHRVGRCITVIHDLTALFVMHELSHSPKSPLSKADLVQAASFEFGDRAARLTEGFEHLSRVATYFFTGQGLALSKSDLVVVHSQYAATRLTFEARPDIRLPPIRVGRHPAMRARRFQRKARISGDPTVTFTVGTFGFHTEIKRTTAIVEGFAAFARQLPEAERSLVRLVLGGRPEPQIEADVETTCRDAGIRDLVELTGFLTEEDLDRRIAECDLCFCLRFPSCGETSGILARIRAAGVPVATTRFAAFAEEPATYQVSPLYEREPEEIMDALRSAYARRGQDGTTYRHFQHDAPAVPLVSEILVERIAAAAERPSSE